MTFLGIKSGLPRHIVIIITINDNFCIDVITFNIFSKQYWIFILLNLLLTVK